MKNHTKSLLALLLSASLLTACSGGGGNGDSTGTETGTETDSDSLNFTYSYGEGLTDEGYFEGVTLKDYVTLCEYKGITIPKDVTDISDGEIDEKVQEMCDQITAETIEITDRAVKDGDTVNIDYVGSVDGEEFSGGSTGGQGTEVTIGVTSYIDDFLEQLIGHMPGETFDVNVTFPDPYPQNAALAGEDAVFVTTINHIVEAVHVEITDDFVKENFGSAGLETIDALRESVKKEMKDEAILAYISEYLKDNCTVTIPKVIIEQQRNSVLAFYEIQAYQYSTTLGELVYSFGYTNYATFLDDQMDTIRDGAREQMMILAIAEAEGMTVTEDEVKEYLFEGMEFEQETYDFYLECYTLPYLKAIKLQEKAVELVKETAIYE